MVIQDAEARAMNAQYQPRNWHLFGAMTVDFYDCALVKGKGKVPFDPQVHSQDQLRTALTLILTPLAMPGRTVYQKRRDIIAESREWANIVKPTVAALGLSLRSLHGKYVEAEWAPTGRKFISNISGEEMDERTFKFLRVFANESDCRRAAEEYFRQRTQGEDAADEPAPAQQAQTNGTPPAPPAEPNRKTLASFLPGYWAKAKREAPDAPVPYLMDLIEGNPMLRKHFTLDSPEVLSLIKEVDES